MSKKDLEASWIAAAIRVEKLKAENERLRGLLPDADERQAIRNCSLGSYEKYGEPDKWTIIVEKWLDRLESDTRDE